MKTKQYAIGADIGGSHISCALVDMYKGSIVPGSHSELKIDNQAMAGEILEGWKYAIKSTIFNVGINNVAGIGFAMPGPFAYSKGIALFNKKVAKFENLFGINIAEELSMRLDLNHELPICFMNDASAFAVGEAWLGAASNVKKSVSITLGTGFGSAFIDNGLPVVEGEGVPPMGCVWHLPFEDSIADDYFSTRWCIARWEELTGENVSGVKEITERALTDERAIVVLEEYGCNMGDFLGPWLKMFNAEILVIGGNIAGAYGYFGPAFEEKLRRQGVTTNIALSKLKEDAAIIGSARMIDPEYWTKVLPVLSKM